MQSSSRNEATVTVIVPVYDGLRELPTLLSALSAQTYPADLVDIVLVDNGGNEGVEALVRGTERVTLVREARPGSYAARNRGLAHARGAVLAFTDVDCEPTETWIERGVATLLAEPGCGAVGGCVEGRFRDASRPRLAEIYESVVAFQQRRYVTDLCFAATANLFTTREVMRAAGPFDARLKSLGDHEWGVRVHRAGYRIVYADDVRVVHPLRRTLRELGLRAARKTGGRYDKSRLKGRSFLALWPDLARSLVPVARLRPLLEPPSRRAGVVGRVLAVQAYVSAVELVERLRLQLGGSSRRT